MEKSYETLVEENNTLCICLNDVIKRLAHANKLYKDVSSQVESITQDYKDLLQNENLQGCMVVRREVQDILFENRESIPEGVYLKLMNALKK
jgi:uncharacterized protein YoxC